MKKLIAFLSVIGALAPAMALAADHGAHAGHGAMHAQAAESALIDGLVKR